MVASGAGGDRVAEGGAAFGLLADGPQGLLHRAFPRRGYAIAPPPSELPKVGAELAGIAQLRSVRRGAQLVALDHVRHRPAHQSKRDAVGSLEADRLDR